MKLRRATPADAALLAREGARLFAETFAADNRPEDMADYLRSAFDERVQAADLARDGSWIWIAELPDGAVAGYAHLRRAVPPAAVVPRPALEIARFYVDRAHHGRGIAQRLMQQCRAHAAAEEAAALWLGVWERNPRAIAFYRKCGFVPVGTQAFVLGGDRQTDVVMVRPLAAAPE